MSNRIRLRAPERMDSRAKDIRLRESAPAVDEAPAQNAEPTQVSITEASTGTMTPSGRSRYRARLIEGDVWGSSGYYSKEVLQRDGPAAWPVGTLSYFDHPTAVEEAERPERSVLNLAAKIVTTPAYEGDGLYAVVEAFAHAAPVVQSLAETIGLSIRANGTASVGTIAGRTGLIIESLTPSPLNSVDMVTVAGAGGKLVSLLEAARAVHLAEARNIEAWFEAQIHSDFTRLADDMYGHGKLTREERITLSSAVGDALTAFTAKLQAEAPQLASRDIYADPNSSDASDASMSEAARLLREATSNEVQSALDAAIRTAYGDDSDVTQWVCVADFDPDQHVVWFWISDNQARQVWQQSYELTTGDAVTAALTGERTEVVARIQYVPVPDDADADVTVSEADSTAAKSLGVEIAEATTDGTPPAESTQPNGEAVMADSPTGTVPATAGATDTAVPTAVTEAVAARTAAETRLAESERKTAALEARLARVDATEAARPIATTMLAESQLPAPARTRVMAQVTAAVPLTEAHALDETAFRAAVTAAVTAEETYLAEMREAAGEGQVTGFGASTTPASTAPDPAVTQALVESYIAGGMRPEAAKLAAAGRP